MKSRFHGRKVDARIFLAEAIRGERNFTDCDLTDCDLAAHPKQVERLNQLLTERCVSPTDPVRSQLIKGNWLDIDPAAIKATMDSNAQRFQAERFYFTQANMTRFCAIGMFFPMVDLRYTYLDSADLTESLLSGAMFDEAEGPSLKAMNADLREAAFLGSRCVRADLSGAALQGSRMIQAAFVNSSFVGANLDGTTLENTDLSGCDFTNASLLKVQGLTTANWGGARFTRTRVSKEDAQAIKTKRELDALDMSTPEHRALRKGK